MLREGEARSGRLQLTEKARGRPRLPSVFLEPLEPSCPKPHPALRARLCVCLQRSLVVPVRVSVCVRELRSLPLGFHDASRLACAQFSRPRPHTQILVSSSTTAAALTHHTTPRPQPPSAACAAPTREQLLPTTHLCCPRALLRASALRACRLCASCQAPGSRPPRPRTSPATTPPSTTPNPSRAWPT